ncbi:MAG: hypothetical protein RSA74_11070 [Chryseobacterium sp.]|uniref:hypothetical protein n=1 Tax=Chryseobacterium sp. TaxID=1871047 RepID=UPI002FC5BE84
MALLQEIYNWFATGKIPTATQFQQTFSSFRHKEEKVPIVDVDGLTGLLNSKLGSNHASDENAHTNVLLKKDASNLTDENKAAFKQALNIGELPDNIATIDDEANGINGNVFDKDQIRNLYLAFADYVVGGKIRADKIEALGLTDLIQASETSLASFVANSGNYEFQTNDFIAIPVNGNYSLYLFKGGNKATAGNYLATGLANITVAMVEGLQTALNSKMDKPTADGLQMVLKIAGGTSYFPVNPATNYLLFFGGNGFTESALYRNSTTGNIGFGTTSPSEQIQLTGRLRAKAVVLEDNPESLPQQITYENRKFYGTDSTGLKRMFQNADYQAFLDTFSGFTQSQASAIANILGGGTGSPGNPSVNLISPPLVQKQYNVNEYILLRGANLNLGTGRKVEILAANKTTVIAIIPDNQVQTYDDGLSLVFYYNFSALAEGQYFIRLTSGVKVYTTSLDLTVVQQIQNVDLSTIAWDFVYAPGVTPSNNDIANSGNFSIETRYGTSVTAKVSLKSSEIFAQGDDFLLELTINLTTKPYTNAGVNRSYIGIGYSSTNNSTSFSSQINLGYDTTLFGSKMNFYNNNDHLGLYDTPIQLVVTFIKTGNVFRTIIGTSNKSITLSNNQGYSIFAQIVGADVGGQVINAQITKAFKFN